MLLENKKKIPLNQNRLNITSKCRTHPTLMFRYETGQKSILKTAMTPRSSYTVTVLQCLPKSLDLSQQSVGTVDKLP